MTVFVMCITCRCRCVHNSHLHDFNLRSSKLTAWMVALNVLFLL